MSTSQAYFEMAKEEREKNKNENLPTMTGDVWDDIRVFHHYHGFTNKKADLKFLASQLGFLKEELDETIESAKEQDGVEIIDGLIDLMVVAAGTLRFFGDNGRDAWIKVMNANCAKDVGFNAKRPDTEGCDLIKPEDWEKPNLMEESRYIRTVMKHSTESQVYEMLRILSDELDKKTERTADRAVVSILEECIDTVRSKSDDYASNVSMVKSADYYPRGIDDFVYMIDVLKRNRQTSILDKARAGQTPNNESLEDTLKDRIVYLALAIEWLHGECPGQRINVDMFNNILGEEC